MLCGERLALETHPHKTLPKAGAQEIVDPLIRHVPSKIRPPVGYSILIVAVLKASQRGSRFNFILPGECVILLWTVNLLIYPWILYMMTIAANKSVKG